MEAFPKMMYTKLSGFRLTAALAFLLYALPAVGAPPGNTTHPGAQDYPIRPVPFTAVHLNDIFWAPKIETNRRVTIPFAFQKCEETGRVENFVHAAEALRGQISPADRKIPPYPFDDTDIYKVIEGASYTLSVKPDPRSSYISRA